MFRIKMRPGSALLSATNDGSAAPSVGTGDVVVVIESTAAFLVRQRAAEILGVIEEGGET
jgi:hypothetical protein